MCATCVAQGSVYVGGALVSLRVMAARARFRRLREQAADPAGDAPPAGLPATARMTGHPDAGA